MEEDIRRSDERNAADAETLSATPRSGDELDGVSRLDLQRRGQLLIEDNLSGPERPAQEAEPVERGPQANVAGLGLLEAGPHQNNGQHHRHERHGIYPVEDGQAQGA